ncbi:24466_t:CDS:2, partial [Racocetra persica]
ILSHALKVWGLELVLISSEEGRASKKIPEYLKQILIFPIYS